MTNETESNEQSRRRFLRTTGAVGVAATTGVAAFGGQAAAQQGNRVDIIGGDTTQTGQQLALSLVSVQLQNVSVNALNQNNVQVFINDTLVNVEDVTVVGGDVVNIDIEDVDVVVGAAINVVVAILGAAAGAAGNVSKFRDETTLVVDELGNVTEQVTGQ